MQMPTDSYHIARYTGTAKGMNRSQEYRIRVHVSFRGRVAVHCYRGYHWEKSDPPLRYYNLDVFNKDWTILKDVEV